MPEVVAFDSYPSWPPLIESEHDEITRKAAAAVGFSPGTISKLQEAVRAPDWEQNSIHWGGLFSGDIIRPNAKYGPDHHCDRHPSHKAAPPLTADQVALSKTGNFIRGEMAAAARAAAAGNMPTTLKHLGAALHALQDCKSHSNYVDLPAAAQTQFHNHLVAGNVPPPAGVKITGYDPLSPTPGLPVGDPYPHDNFAKDNPTKNPESQIVPPGFGGLTKFQLAYNAAIAESIQLLRQFQTTIGNPAWGRLLLASTGTVAPDQYPWQAGRECALACVWTGRGISVEADHAGFEVWGLPATSMYGLDAIPAGATEAFRVVNLTTGGGSVSVRLDPSIYGPDAYLASFAGDTVWALLEAQDGAFFVPAPGSYLVIGTASILAEPDLDASIHDETATDSTGTKAPGTPVALLLAALALATVLRRSAKR